MKIVLHVYTRYYRRSFCISAFAWRGQSEQPEMRMQFAGVIERRLQRRLKPRIEDRSNIGRDSCIASNKGRYTLYLPYPRLRGIPHLCEFCDKILRQNTKYSKLSLTQFFSLRSLPIFPSPYKNTYQNQKRYKWVQGCSLEWHFEDHCISEWNAIFFQFLVTCIHLRCKRNEK